MNPRNNTKKLTAIYKGLWLICLLLLSSVLLRAQKADFTNDLKTIPCSPVTVNFTDASTGGGGVKSRQWDLGNGLISNTDAKVGINYYTPKKYTIRLTVTFNDGTVDTEVKELDIHPKPIADFSASAVNGCGPLVVNFTDLSDPVSGTIDSLTWSIGEGLYKTKNPTHTFNGMGDYTVTLFVKNSWGCKSDATIKDQFIKVHDRPSPSFEIAPKNNCELPFTPVITNNSSGAGTITYEWNFGDGSPLLTDVNPSHTYTTDGIYRITLKASNGANCDRTSAAQTIYVGKPPGTPVLTASSNICVNNSASFSVSGVPNEWLDKIEWNFGNGTRTTNGNATSNAYSSAGTYPVSATVFYMSGCQRVLNTSVIVFPTPSVTVAADPTVACKFPFTSSFTATPNPANPDYEYEWNFGDGKTQTGKGLTTVSNTYNSAGNFQVTVKITDPNNPNPVCNNATAATNVHVSIPSIDLYRITPDRQCKPVNATFDSYIYNLRTPSADIVYTWDYGDGSEPVTVKASGLGAAAQHLYPSSGLYTVRVTAVTADGCSMTDQADIIVPEDCPPPPPFPDLPGGSYNDNGGACDNYLSYSFTAHNISNTSVLSWDFGDPTSPDNTAGAVNQVSHVFSGPGNYTITIKRLFIPTGDTLTGTRSIEVKHEPLVFSISATPMGTCPAAPVSFAPVDLDPERVRQYHWNFGDGSLVRNIGNPNPPAAQVTGATTWAYDANGTYSVSLSVTDRKGCETDATATVDIIVNGPAADFSADILSSCESSFDVSFTPNATAIDPSSPITEWHWNFGDGVTRISTTADTVKHTYKSTSYYRTFNVSLTVKDANGCQSEVHLKPEYIKAYNPQASFYASSPLRCNEYDVRFNNNSSVKGEPVAPNFKFIWDYGDGSPLFNTNSDAAHSHVYPRDGEYTVKLIVMDENGCTDTSVMENYVRIVHPKADFEPGSSITECAPISLSFDNLSEVYGQNATYSWTFGYGNTKSTLKTPNPVIYPVPNDYKVTLTIESMGCTDVVEKIINVKGPRGTLHSDVFEGCRPLDIKMSVTGSNISSYAWDFDDGTVVIPSPDQNAAEHVYTVAGIYSPNIILTSPEGCAFTLRPPEKVTVDSLQVIIGLSDTAFCGEGTVSFSNSSILPAFSTITKQTWNMGDGSSFEGAVPPAHLYNAAGIYNVQLITETEFGCKEMSVGRVLIGEQPVVTIDGPDVVCLTPGSGIQYKASITSAPNPIYHWRLEGNTVGTDINVLDILSRQPGTYDLSLQVSANGCIGNAEKKFIVDSVKARFRINDSLHCGDANVVFTNMSTAASPIANFAWNTGDPTNTAMPISGGNYHYPTPGVYYPSLSLETVHGCRGNFVLPEKIKIYTPPQLQFAAPDEICAGNALLFTANLQSEDEAQPVQWYLNNAPVHNGPDYTKHFPVAESYVISAATQTRYGCSTTVSHPLQVNPLPVPNARPVTATICEGTEVPLHAEDGTQYQWTSPSGIVPAANTANPLVTPSLTTKYHVLVTNEHGCTQTDSVAITVDKKVNLVHSENAVICIGNVVRLQASGNTQQFTWSPAESLTRADIPDPIARPEITTTYQVIGKSSNVCPDETGHILVAVGQYPTVNIGPDLILKGGDVYPFNPTVSNDVVQYAWRPTTWLSCSNCKMPELTANDNTTYTLTVTNDYNCSTTDTVNVQVVCNRDAIYIPNSFTPNGDGLNDIFYIPGFGVEKIKSFTVYSRYGDVVFSQTDVPLRSKQYGWDGTIKGKRVEVTTVFVYTAEIVCDGQPLFFKGTVTLIR